MFNLNSNQFDPISSCFKNVKKYGHLVIAYTPDLNSEISSKYFNYHENEINRNPTKA